jgi:exodeoxyribonuclease-1
VNTFFFYDLETTGLNAREDRIMQFAGQRTDMDLSPLGDPINLLIKLTDDTLPSPHAILATKITPQQTQADGLTEAEFAKYLTEEIFTPGTIATGYNSIRFDDEFIRHLFWRNFHDPYEWSWKDGRSRWDLLDVIRLTRALRPEGINWPVDKDNKPTNRLELITKENNISHESAHDALSDVTALIGVAKLIKEKQPQLFDYLLKLRDKKEVQKLVNLDYKQPFVYASGRYASEHNKTTIAFPLTSAPNSNVVVFDLRHNIDELLNGQNKEIDSPSSTSSAETGDRTKETRQPTQSFFPVVKTLQYNRCPAVAPLSVLEKNDGWNKINLTKEQIETNLSSLLSHPDFAEKIRSDIENRPDFPPAIDPESALYDSFLPDSDRIYCEAVRNATAKSLADFHPTFTDERLPELLIHYKARNYPKSLSKDEQTTWELYRLARLERQSENYLNTLTALAEKNADPYVLEELYLWHQSLLPYNA